MKSQNQHTRALTQYKVKQTDQESITNTHKIEQQTTNQNKHNLLPKATNDFPRLLRRMTTMMDSKINNNNNKSTSHHGQQQRQQQLLLLPLSVLVTLLVLSIVTWSVWKLQVLSCGENGDIVGGGGIIRQVPQQQQLQQQCQLQTDYYYDGKVGPSNATTTTTTTDTTCLDDDSYNYYNSNPPMLPVTTTTSTATTTTSNYNYSNNENELLCKLFVDEYVWSYVLIFAHLVPFVLMPVTMYIVYLRLPMILSQNAMFSLLLGLGSICVGCGFEFSWHIDQLWYYSDGYHIGNYLFYFFLITSFILWSYGMKENTANGSRGDNNGSIVGKFPEWMLSSIDIVHVLFLVVFVILYPVGAIMYDNNPKYKIPIYVALTVTFTTLSIRGISLLNPYHMLWVPFFSVFVNLYFIVLLKLVDKHDNDTIIPHSLSKWNYIYHAAHDLFGTELGVAVFAYLVYKHKNDDGDDEDGGEGSHATATTNASPTRNDVVVAMEGKER